MHVFTLLILYILCTLTSRQREPSRSIYRGLCYVIFPPPDSAAAIDSASVGSRHPLSRARFLFKFSYPPSER